MGSIDTLKLEAVTQIDFVASQDVEKEINESCPVYKLFKARKVVAIRYIETKHDIFLQDFMYYNELIKRYFGL